MGHVMKIALGDNRPIGADSSCIDLTNNTEVAFDSFSRIDGAIGTADSGHVWSSSTPNVFYIVSNSLQGTGLGVVNALVETGLSDATLSCSTSGQLNNATNFRIPSLILRAKDPTNFLYLDLYNGQIRFGKTVNNVSTVLATASFSTPDNTLQNFKITANGNVITCLINDVQRLQYTLTGGDTIFSSYTQYGVWFIPSGSQTYPAVWKNFKVERLNTQLGFILTDYKVNNDIGKDPDYYKKLRTISIELMCIGTSPDDVRARIEKLKTIIESKTISYIRSKGAMQQGRSDGKSHEGETAVLTMRPNSASELRYYDVYSGAVELPSSYLTYQLASNKVTNIKVTLRVEAGARANQVWLENGVEWGDFPDKFIINDAFWGCGWVFSDTTYWALSTDYTYFQPQVLRFSGAPGATNSFLSTNAMNVSTGDVIVGGCWWRGNIISTSTFNLRFTMQGWNGSTWSNVWSFSPTSDPATWTKVSNADAVYTVPAGISQVRFNIGGPSSGKCYFSGLFLWRVKNGQVPTTEYIGSGRTLSHPYYNGYGFRGDAPARANFSLSLSEAIQPSFSWNRYILIGRMNYDTVQENPLLSLDLKLDDGGESTNTAFPHGKQPTQNTTAGNTSTTKYSTNTKQASRAAHLYRLLALYNSANTVSGSSFSILINSMARTFNGGSASGTGQGPASTSNFAIAEVGDLWFERPGSGIEDQRAPLSGINSSTETSLNYTHNSAGMTNGLGAAIPVPADEFCVINSGFAASGSQGSATYLLINEGPAPQLYYRTSNGYTLNAETYRSDKLIGGNFSLIPNPVPSYCNHFEIWSLMKSGALYFGAQNAQTLAIFYSPVYEAGT